MLKYFKQTGYSLFICFTLILATSCNSSDKGEKDKDDVVIDTTELAKAAFIGGFYDTLWVNRSAFNTIAMGTKMVFYYTIKADDKLTLGGWIVKNNFDPNPNVQLDNGRPGIIPYGPGTYYKSIMLQASEFNKLKTKLNQNPTAQYVLFAPTENPPGNFTYKIFLSDVNPAVLGGGHILAIIDTEGEANPSPPKNY